MRDGSRQVLSSPHDRGITMTTLTTTPALRHLLSIHTRTITTMAVAIEAATTKTIHRVEVLQPMTMAEGPPLTVAMITIGTTVAQMVEGMDTATIPYGDGYFDDGREGGLSRHNDGYVEDGYEDRGSRGYRTLSIYRVRSF